jgi:hypothetical protein
VGRPEGGRPEGERQEGERQEGERPEGERQEGERQEGGIVGRLNSWVAGLAMLGMAAVSSQKVEQTTQGSRPAVAMLSSCDGLAGRNPSDNTLAVGPNHVFQIVNSRMAILRSRGKWSTARRAPM